MKNLRKILFKPLWRIRDYLSAPKYRPHDYWETRHGKYGFDLRGVGNRTLSDEENKAQYDVAREIFLNLCCQEKIDFKTARMLDVGCGTGFYAEIFAKAEGLQYRGVDITDKLFQQLYQRFPELKFSKLDISKQRLDSCFDLIIMIDVTQHIVNNRKFSFAMQNIRSHLTENGVFIVTSWLADKLTKRTYYEVARPLGLYENEFPDYYFSKPIKFRDKFIFIIRKHKLTE